ncbi:glycoside hydrolase family 2 TIM barrel-domain containing protein [Pontiella sulfatireligans]|uniref:Beta-galactosidase BoGH2A n=1 Tax=Pontiella sulfatireligans TaxID=2750658 RepID=A0A6C2UKK0_9BACT|nr:glycoside hydrolase family 2 TIM barrel-domain containing protein [Pontiella sulfatireligans]VGO20413.1 Beta-galactosidase BoGH2A [Pontiella sulfatireligans]
MKTKIMIPLLAGIMTAGIVATEANEIQTKVRKQEKFNANWKFSLSDNPEYREPGFTDSTWRTLNVPHDWSIEGEYQPNKYMGMRGGFFPEGIGWYRKCFTVDPSKKNKQFTIQFDGVFRNSEVYVNGRFMGRRPYGYATFQYDITSALKFGEDNVIAVRVDNSVPAGSRWYSGSGIYRNVHLIETGYVHFRNRDGVYITTPVVEKDEAVVNAGYKIVGSFFSDEEIKLYKKNKWLRLESCWENTPKAHACTIRSIVYDAEGKEVARSEKTADIYNYDKNFSIDCNVGIKEPNRWSADTPYLYTLKSEIEFEGRILDDQVTTFGVRKLEYIQGKGLFVNGQETILKGVCLHHDGGSVGAAVPEKLLRYRLQKLKDIGCNAIRTSHNPFAPEFYALCDEMGFYVKDEVIDEWTSAWGYNFTEKNTSKAGYGYAMDFNQWHETDLAETIQRDRNHPSVIMYGIGNEIPDFRSEVAAAQANCRKLLAICQREDNTRPVCLGNNGATAGNLPDFEVLGYNYVREDYGHKLPADECYELEHKKYPNQLMLSSETSRNEVSYYTSSRDLPYVIGQFIWTGIQYLGEVKAPKSGLRGWLASLLDMKCKLLPGGALYDAAWNEGQKPVLHISASELPFDTSRRYEIVPVTGERVYNDSAERFSWNWKNDGDKYVMVYSNCEEVELLLNGKPLGRQKTDFMKFRTEWTVPYEKGTLEAIGFNNGKPVMSRQLVTSGAPVKLMANPVWPMLEKDGVDVNLIEVSIMDDKGHLVTDAENTIKIEVDGGAELLGMDTGNLFYKGLFQADTRSAADGTILVIIRSKKSSDPVRMKITSAGLKSAILDFD